ncbi:SCO family protein [Kitasatospora arboriphila]
MRPAGPIPRPARSEVPTPWPTPPSEGPAARRGRPGPVRRPRAHRLLLLRGRWHRRGEGQQGEQQLRLPGQRAEQALRQARPRPDRHLRAAVRPAQADRGQPVVLFFGYTSCPDVCPTTMGDIGVAMSKLSAEEQKKIDVVFVSTDPERDTPKVLRTWLDSMGKGFIGLTGDLAEVKTAARTVGVAVQDPVVNADGSVTSAHGAQVLAFLPSDDKAHVLWMGSSTVETYSHDLALLAKGCRREPGVPAFRADRRGTVRGAGHRDDTRGVRNGIRRRTGRPQHRRQLRPGAGAARRDGRRLLHRPQRRRGGRPARRGDQPGRRSVTMHTSGESTMTAVDSLQVPAHGALELARGGHHLMIMGWQKPPAVGDELELDLTFAKSGTITVTVPVKPLTYRPGS